MSDITHNEFTPLHGSAGAITRAWLGIALLAVSWLFGTHQYYNAQPLWWLATIALGTLCLWRTVTWPTPPAVAVLAAVLLAPAAVWMPAPYKAIPALLVLGAGFAATAGENRATRRLADMFTLGGVVLLAQGLTLVAFQYLSGRTHELAPVFAALLGALFNLLGHNAAVSGNELTLYAMRQSQSFGVTWDLLADVVSLAIITGGAIFATRWLRSRAGTPPGAALLQLGGALVLLVLLWLPLRAVLLLALYMTRLLRTDYDARLDLMNQFWSPWVALLLGLVPALLMARLHVRLVKRWAARGNDMALREDSPAVIVAAPTPGTGAERAAPPTERRADAAPLKPVHRLAIIGLVPEVAGLALVAMGVFWDPAGTRRPGRVLFDEAHGEWEPTNTPFDTEWYGDKVAYTYTVLYNYMSRYYDVGRIEKAPDADPDPRKRVATITPEVLKSTAVLVLKVPTSRYLPEEIKAIRDFVDAGGGLLLIGEHTNFYRSGTVLNEIAQHYGFRFRDDCIFDIDEGFEQAYHADPVPHPIVQHIRQWDWAGSCSIEPHTRRGRNIVLSTGLKNLPAEYHVSNYYPPLENRPDMRSGAFVQLWSTRSGKGRVVAFSDSTQFSNFCVFDPGKSDLFLGMVEWLHRGDTGDPRFVLFVSGAGLVITALVLLRPRRGTGITLPLLAAGLIGWTGGAALAGSLNRAAFPAPLPDKPLTRIVIDRTLCETVLPTNGFIGGKSDGYGLFEQFIMRLGFFYARRSGAAEVFAKDASAVVFLEPTKIPTAEFTAELVRYVEAGGKVLLLDAPDSAGSTANTLLHPFGLELQRSASERGTLTSVADEGAPAGSAAVLWPSIQIDASATIEITPRARKGAPHERADVLALVNGKPVIAHVRYGKGDVVVVACGRRFNDPSMGMSSDIVPNAVQRAVFETHYKLFRLILKDAPAIVTGKDDAAAPAALPDRAPDGP